MPPVVEEIETIWSRLIRKDTSLKSLVLEEPRSLHCEPNFEAFIEALHGNESITSVKLGGHVVQFTEDASLAILLDAIGTLPNIEYMEFNIPHINTQTRLTGRALARCIRRAQNLKVVIMWPFIRFHESEEVSLFAEAIRGHASLEQLVFLNILLGFEHTEACLDGVVETLSTIPNLKCFHLAAGLRSKGCWISEYAFAHMIENCKTMENLALRNLGLTNEHAIELAKYLTTEADTTRLLVVDLRFNAVGEEGYKALAGMTEQNLRVQNVCIDARQGELLKRLEFNLKLNQAGRYTVLKDSTATRRQKIEKLIESKDDPIVTFYLLSCAPSLCDTD